MGTRSARGPGRWYRHGVTVPARIPPRTPFASPAVLDPWPVWRLVAAAWVGIFLVALCTWRPIGFDDTWFHLALGRTISTSGLPRVDTWSWSAHGMPFTAPGWLAEWGMFHLWQFGGLAAIGLLVPLAVLATAGATMASARWLGARLGPATAVGVAAGLSTALAPHPRPLLFGLVVTAPSVAVAITLALGRARWWRWVLVLFFGEALWVNIHPGAPALLGLVALAGLGVALDARGTTGEVQRVLGRTGVGLVAVLVGSGFSPYGLGAWGHIIVVRSQASTITEWAHAWDAPESLLLLLPALGALLAAIVWAVRSDRRGPVEQNASIRWAVIVPALGWLPLGLDAIRHDFQLLTLAALAAAVTAPMIGARLRSHRGPLALAVAMLVAGLATPLLTTAPGVVAGGIERLARPNPGATAGSSAIPEGGRVLCDLTIGSYLSWARPDVTTSTDPRNPAGMEWVIHQDNWLTNSDVTAGLAAIRRYRISAVLTPWPAPLIRALISRGWQPVGAAARPGPWPSLRGADHTFLKRSEVYGAVAPASDGQLP